MKKILLTALFAAATAFGQEHGAAASPAHPPASAGAHGGEAATTTAHPAPGAHEQSQAAQHGSAVAQHGEAHAEERMPNEDLWKWANFALLALGLGYLISKNAPAFFRGRTEEIQKGIAEATRTRQEAEARAADIERRVSNLQAEVAQIRTQSREEIAREGERIRLETEAAIRKIQAQSQAEIASAAKHAAHDLKAYSAHLALQQAEQQLRGQMTQPAQDGLTTAFVDELRRKAVKN